MTSDAASPVRLARGRRDWRAVHAGLASASDELSTSDLGLLAEAAWWLGDSPESMAVSERVYTRLIAEGETHRAADRALRLALEWMVRGDVSVGMAWLARARRVIADLPRGVLHGYLLYVDAAADLDLTGPPEDADEAARQIDALAREHDDPTLRSFALVTRGLAAVRRGHTRDGFADLDQAMLPVVAGQVDALWSGDLYCTVIHLCDELGDLARMRAWTEGMTRWAEPQGRSFMYAHVARIHELQLLVAEGAWETVEAELGARSADLVGAHGWLAGEGYYTLGEVRRLRGDAAGAREAYDLARALNHDALPGAALLTAAGGSPGEALDELRIGLADATRLGRARMLPAAVDLALAEGEPTYARTLAAELEETAEWFSTPGLLARAAQARAAILVAEDRPAAAASPPRDGDRARGPRARPPRGRSTGPGGRRGRDRARDPPPARCRARRRTPLRGRAPPVRADGAGAGGAESRRGGRDQPGGRRRAGDQREDGRSPPRQHLHQGRGRHAHRRCGLGARQRRDLRRTPHAQRRRWGVCPTRRPPRRS
jgi:hypothetical protein